MLSLCILFIFMTSFYFGAFFIPMSFGSVQDEDYSIESDFNVFENLPYMYSGTFYESTDYKYQFHNAKIQFQFEDFSYDEEYDVTDSLDNSESNQAYGEDNYTFTDGSGADFDNMMAEDLLYTYFNYTGIGLYNATYSFTDELEGTENDNIEFVDSTNYATCIIIGSLDGHNKVLKTISDANSQVIYQNFEENQEIGTIEFWVQYAENNKKHEINFMTDGTNSFGLLFYNTGDVYYYNGGWVLTGESYLANTWYHIRLEFDVDDDWHLWMDGVSIDDGVGYGYNGAPSYINKLRLYASSDNGETSYYDAIDYSWSPSYEDGRNREENWVPIDYEATYSFEDDAVGSVPSGWGEAATATVVPAFNKHNQVIEMVRDGSTAIISQTFTDGVQTSGTVEFWFGSDDVTRLSHARLYSDGGSSGLYVSLSNDKIQYYDGGYIDITDAKDNVMYHIRIDFECAGGAYKGLAADTFYIYVDGVKFGAYPFKVAVDDIDSLYFTLNSGNVYNSYVDAVGYSWTTYDIGDNTIFTPSMIDNFPATYSFYKQPVFTSELDIDFIDGESSTGTLNINAKSGDHRKTIYFNPALDWQNFYNEFDNQENGTIEFWLKKIDSATTLQFTLRLEGDAVFELSFDPAGDILHYTTLAGQTDIGDFSANTWYHYKIIFDCFKEYVYIYQNNVLIGGGILKFREWDVESYTYINRLYFGAHNDNDLGELEFHIDAIGYSFDNRYLIGDNLNDNFYLGYENFEGYNKTEYGNYFGTYSFDDIKTEEGVYYGTYDFRDDAGNTGTGISWVDSQSGTDAVIEALVDGHKIVLMQTDINSYCYNAFDAKTSGIIEYWFRTTDAALRTNIYMYGGGGDQFSFRIQFDTFIYTDGSAVTTEWEILDDTWYHLKYEWRADGTTDIYCNGVLEVDNETLTIVGTGYTSLRLQTYDTHDSYLDAVGYSWDTTSHSGLGYEV